MVELYLVLKYEREGFSQLAIALLARRFVPRPISPPLVVPAPPKLLNIDGCRRLPLDSPAMSEANREKGLE